MKPIIKVAIIALSLILMVGYSMSTTTETSSKFTSRTQTESHSQSSSSMSLKSRTNSKTEAKSSIFESFRAFITKGRLTNRHTQSPDPQAASKAASPDSQASSQQSADPQAESQDAVSSMGPKKPPQQDNDSNLFGINGDIELGEGPIWYQGWVKYFRYVYEDHTRKPQAFFKNPSYLDQEKKPQDKRDPGEQVPGPLEFYASLYKDNLVLTESKAKSFTSQYDILKIDYIKPVIEESKFEGGILDFGSFKEGECFRVLTNQGGKWTWVICTKTGGEKAKLMNVLKKILIKHQRDAGFVNAPKVNEKKKMTETQAKLNGATLDMESLNVSMKNNLADGYWIVLQNWSTCTVRCGGGTQTLHRMCVPPKNGGAPCEGKAIVTKPCNEQACPESKNSEEKETFANKLKDPNIKIMPFSSRPQRYDKCHLKESDVLFTASVPDKLQLTSKSMKTTVVQIPVRLVMNQRTVAAYSGTEYTDLKVSFDIQKARFLASSRDRNCFVIQERGSVKKNSGNSKKKMLPANFEAEFCPFGMEASSLIKSEWDYDFNLFKYQCHEEREISPVESQEDEDELNKQKDQARLDLISKKRKEVLEREEKESDYTTKKLKSQSFQAIQKELDMERMILDEEKEHEDEVRGLKMKELEKEKKKADCLNKAIKAKEEENQYNIAKAEKDETLTDFKANLSNEIKIRRAKLKTKLMNLKKRASNDNSLIDQEILNIRLEMANALTRKKGKGNPNLCLSLADKLAGIAKKANSTEGNEEEEFKSASEYCTGTYVTDPESLAECKTAVEEKNIHLFLEICCDHEVATEDMDAYKKCLHRAKLNKKPEDKDARFFWDNSQYDRKKFGQTSQE